MCALKKGEKQLCNACFEKVTNEKKREFESDDHILKENVHLMFTGKGITVN